MGRRKAWRKAVVLGLPNVLDVTAAASRGGVAACFPRLQPLVLELGCGRGESLLQLARQYPERNFVGLDRNGARIWSGATSALRLNLTNVIFLRGDVEQVGESLQNTKVAEAWLLFPDPHPRTRRSDRRLTTPRRLRLYRELLTESADVHLKTDDRALCDYTLAAVEEVGGTLRTVVHDVWQSDLRSLPAEIETSYERRYRAEGRAIHYVRFTLGRAPASLKRVPQDSEAA